MKSGTTRQKALRRKQSLNEVVLKELAVAMPNGARREDFSDLVGKWTSDPSFDEMLAAQRQIDPEVWK